MPVEKDIVERAVRGDKDAFAQLYEKHFDRIYRYIYFRLGSKTATEDLTQDVFLKALEAIGSFKWRRSPFAAWLYHGKVEKVPLEDEMELTDKSDTASIAENELEIERMIASIDKLTPSQKDVISLRFGAQLTIAEAAKTLGKNEGTVKALQYNGILALKKMLLAGE
jgi:RNA polymerase sigma-70 factor (ECF subfamily)